MMEKEPKIPTKEERVAGYKKLPNLNKANRFNPMCRQPLITMFSQPLIKDKKPRLSELETALKELMDASAPYLKRKKETPRRECARLNEVHKRVREILERK